MRTLFLLALLTLGLGGCSIKFSVGETVEPLPGLSCESIKNKHLEVISGMIRMRTEYGRDREMWNGMIADQYAYLNRHITSCEDTK